eukprot:gene3023-5807_t
MGTETGFVELIKAFHEKQFRDSGDILLLEKQVVGSPFANPYDNSIAFKEQTPTFREIDSLVRGGGYSTFSQYEKDISEACLNLRRKLGQNQNQLKYMNDFEANLKEAFLSHRIHLKNLEFKNDQKNCHGEMPGVQPKKTSPVNLKSRFHLPMYNPARADASASRVASLLSPFLAVRPRSHIEKNWNHSVPATDLTYSPWISFGPVQDGSEASVDDYGADILLSKEQPCVLRTVDVMGMRKEEMMYELESILDGLDEDKELDELISSFQEEERSDDIARSNLVSLAKSDSNSSLSKADEPSSNEADCEVSPIADLSSSGKTSINQILSQNEELLRQMQDEQIKRVASGKPWEITSKERRLAKTLRKNLSVIVARAAPKDVTTISSIRKLARVQEITPATKPKQKHALRYSSEDIDDSGMPPLQRPKHTQQNTDHVGIQSKWEVSDIIICEQCGGIGLRWPRLIRHGIPELLCFACGYHWEAYRLPRPIVFESDKESALRLQAKPYLFRTK